MALSTVYKHLPAMLREHLAARGRDGRITAREPKALTRFARKHRIAERLAAVVTRWRTERNCLRIAHGLPGLLHQRGTVRVAWPGQPPSSIGPRFPTSCAPDPATPEAIRTAQERAIGGGDPDWRTDLEQAALALLRRKLKARILNERRPTTA